MARSRSDSWRSAVGLLLALAAAASCVPGRDAAFAPVAGEIERRVGVRPRWSERDGRVPAAIAGLLARPLDRDAVVRIALATSPRLQVAFDELGVARGAIAEATVLGPTEVDLQYRADLDGDDGEGAELEVDVIQDVLGLVALGRRRAVAGAELAAARARAVATAVALAGQAETALYDVVAAGQAGELARAAFDAAAAAAELAERLRAAGNVNLLEVARRQDARETARAELARAELAIDLARARLDAVLGLDGEAARWTAIARLPALPASPPPVDALAAEAVAASLELRGLRAEADGAAGRLGLARLRAFLPELGVGVAATRRDDGSWAAGPALRIGLPIFDWQGGPRARAHAALARTRHATLATAVELRAAARSAGQRLLAAHAEARHLREVVVPLRARLVAESVLQHNAMNASAFELLEARRVQLAAARRLVDAERRFWIASAEVRALRRGAAIGALAGAPPASGDEAAGGAAEAHPP